VDLNGLPELSHIDDDGSNLRIGGMTRHSAVERSRLVAEAAPLLYETMPFIAHPAIRTRGTIGGSLAHADPAAELPAVMLALDAQITVRSRDASRVVPAAEFFIGLFSTTLGPGELLTEICLPRHDGKSGWAFQEVSRRHGDFALAGVAAAVTLDERGRCSRARIALLSVGDRPLLATQAAAALTGQLPSAAAIRAAARTASQEEIDPTSDIHASSQYRRHLAEVLTRRALERAFERAA
jgi:CO/xanthine dehydrogenase FAD-binding subunit